MNFVLPQLTDPASAGDDVATGFAALLRRRRGMFFVVFSVPLVLALITIFGVPPSFYAAGTVMIGEQESTSNSASSAGSRVARSP